MDDDIQEAPSGGMSGSGDPGSLRSIRTFVLRSGRMTESQQRDYKTLSGRWCLPFSYNPVNYTDVFENAEPVVIEIGFGMGQATARIAAENPSVNYIGIEVHRPGVGRLLGEIEKRGLRNIRIIEHDALEVLEYMTADNSVSAFHVFFPDPWPKKRHHKRRLMQRPHTDLLAAKLSRGGYIYMATDWEPYAQSALRELEMTDGLKNTVDGFAPRRVWRPETRFEVKGLNADRDIYELFFEKT